MRRFVRHVLPRGFVKVRHYGLLGNRHRADKLKVCRRLLLPVAVMGTAAEPATQRSPLQPSTTAEAKLTPAPAQHCPRCGGCRFIRLPLPKEADDSGAARVDTS